MSKDSVSSVSIDYQTSAAEVIRQQTKLSVGTSDTNNDINNAEPVTSEYNSARPTSATVPNTEQSDVWRTNTMDNQGHGVWKWSANDVRKFIEGFCFLSKVR